MFGKILIVLLMLTSLIPSMSLGGSNVRYLPAFNVLLMIAVYALFCLKDRENREHLWAYYKGNKYILIVVVLYIITIWVSSLITPSVRVSAPLIRTSAPGTPQTFSVKYDVAKGPVNRSEVYFLVNYTPIGDNAIDLRYVQRTNTFSLLTPKGWVGCSPGAAISLTSSQGTLNCANTTVTFSGNNLTINWNITPNAEFASTTAKNLYAAQNTGAASLVWNNIGNWTIDNTGLKESMALLTGISAVLFIMHFLFPLLVKTREDFIFVIKALFVIGLLNAIFAAEFFLQHKLFNSNYGIFDIVDFFGKFNMLPTLKVPRLMGVFLNSNSLGILMSITMPAGLMLIMESNKLPSKLMFALYVLGLVFALISSFSRASILASIITFIVFLALRRKVIFDTFRVVMAALVVLLITLIFTGAKLDVLQALWITSPERIYIWGKAIDAIHTTMLSGIGASNIASFLLNPLVGVPQAAHNTYIEIALGFGVIALFLYSVYLIITIQRIKWHEDRNLSIYAMLVFSNFSVLQLFETLQFGGLSIANFYFLASVVSYLSVTALTFSKPH